MVVTYKSKTQGIIRIDNANSLESFEHSNIKRIHYSNNTEFVSIESKDLISIKDK